MTSSGARAATTSRSPAGRHTRPIPTSSRCGWVSSRRKKNGAMTTRAPHFMTGSSVGERVGHILAALDKPPAPIIARAKSAEGERLSKEATDAARKLGIFGAPTFAIGAEIFWGDDRLEDALNFAAGR